jgi:hypothetical protein
LPWHFLSHHLAPDIKRRWLDVKGKVREALPELQISAQRCVQLQLCADDLERIDLSAHDADFEWRTSIRLLHVQSADSIPSAAGRSERTPGNRQHEE